jgi:hypothetical protein
MSKIISNVFNVIKNNLTVFLLFFVWLVVTIFNLRIYWMLVDDGGNIVFSRTLFEKISSLNIMGFASQLLESVGRFRPVYWLYQMTVWIIGRNSYQFQHFAHMLVIGLTVLFIYLIIRELTKSKIVSFFGALTYLLIPINSENIFRLGPQEPLMVLFLSVLFYLIVKNKKVFLACIILFLAVFTKETSVALLPVLFFHYFYGKNNKLINNRKQGFYLLITICVSAILIILIIFLIRNGYSTNYYFDLHMLIGNLVVYLKDLSKNTLFIFPVFFVIFCLRIICNLFKKQNIFFTKLDFFEFLFGLGFICFLFIQLPWKYALTRYLMPAIFFLIIFLCLEIYQDLILLSNVKLINNHRLVFIPLIVIGVYVCLVWGFQLVFNETSSISYEATFKQMASYPKNTILLMNLPRGEGTIELVYETQIELSEFWNRDDLKVDYLDLHNLPSNNFVIVDFGQSLNDKSNPLYKNKLTVIENTSKALIITTPWELVKQSTKKLFNLLIYKKQFTSDGLYTYYYYRSNWYFYDK